MGGIAELGLNLSTLITQIISFAILFGALYVVAYKPLMRIMDERSQRVKESLEQAESVKEQSARAEDEVRKRLEEASREGQERIARAVEMGEDVKRKAQEDARKQADGILDRARGEIRRERDEAIGELRQEFADLTVLAAGKVIDRSLSKEDHRQLIEEVLEESTTLKED